MTTSTASKHSTAEPAGAGNGVTALWLRTGECTVVAGRPAVGKSTLFAIVAVEALRGGRRVLWWGPAEAQDDVIARLALADAGAEWPIFPAERAGYDDAVARVSAWPLAFVDADAPMETLAAVAAATAPELLVVDDLGLIATRQHVGIGAILAATNNVAAATGATVVAGASVGRRVVSQRARLALLRDVHDVEAIVSVADTVVILSRPEAMLFFATPARWKDRAWLTVHRRRIEPETIEVGWDWRRRRFSWG